MGNAAVGLRGGQPPKERVHNLASMASLTCCNPVQGCCSICTQLGSSLLNSSPALPLQISTLY